MASTPTHQILPFFVAHVIVCGLSIRYFARVIRIQVVEEKILAMSYREEAHHYRIERCSLPEDLL